MICGVNGPFKWPDRNGMCFLQVDHEGDHVDHQISWNNGVDVLLDALKYCANPHVRNGLVRSMDTAKEAIETYARLE